MLSKGKLTHAELHCAAVVKVPCTRLAGLNQVCVSRSVGLLKPAGAFGASHWLSVQ